MKKSSVLFLLLLMIVSCENHSPVFTEKEVRNEVADKEKIIQKILNIPDLQWMFHSGTKERLPVKIMESKVINKDLRLYKFGQQVRIVSLQELKKAGIADYIEFDRLDIGKDSVYFKLHYHIEGAGSKGILIRKDGDWKVIELKIWEN